MSTNVTNTARIGVLNRARIRETTVFAEGQGYERPLATGRKLRVILSGEADAEIISFTSNYAIEWKARFDSAVPLAVFEAAIMAAIGE